MKTEVMLNQLEFNPFSMIQDEGFLISVSQGGRDALMTAGWGAMGFLWNRPIVTVYVRPSRYTFDFLKSSSFFTVSFFPPKMASTLAWCGSYSGRDTDKLAGSGLTACRIGDYLTYEEAGLTFACRKIYMREMDERLVLDKEMTHEYYGEKDVHWSFTGQIEHVYI